jgi:oligo-1,6-glucosidase
MRPTYVHTAVVRLAPGGEPTAPGGAVTQALCGGWDHPGTDCRWPHHNAWQPAADGKTTVRVVFACDPDDEQRVRALVAGALAAGSVVGPSGPQHWALESQAQGVVRADERALAERLSGTPWWTGAVVYQVYPRSFADSDGDGMGDLPGVTAHLDHLAWLGVDVVWLSPVYRSPQHDNGYDISDYQDVDPAFGTLADLDALIAGCHARGIRLVMDLVVNHTSDEHPWFVAARSSKDDAKRDWYWWRPARDGMAAGSPGAEPTNWRSAFSGPAWTYDEASGEYYLHLFAPQQPDLNWENPQVREAVFAMMRWWLDRGVDGFRMDVVNLISKAVRADGSLPDGHVPAGALHGDGTPHVMCGPRIHEFLAAMHREVFADRPGRLLTVGEMPGVTVEEARLFTDPARAEVDMVFQFEHVGLDQGTSKWDVRPFDLRALKASFGRWQAGLADVGWNSLYWDNHDQPRAVSRFGDDGEHRVAAAKMLATVLHLHRGTPYVYQGEEIGMTNAPFAAVDDLRDVESLNHYREAVELLHHDPDDVLAAIRVMGRDNARTPMQWDAGPNAGFGTGTPWLAVNPNHIDVNVAAGRADAGSVLHHYRALVALRHEEPAVALGDFTMLLPDDPDVYAFTRRLGGTELLVLGNFGATPQDPQLPDAAGWAARRPPCRRR